MRIALDATYSIDPHPSGIAIYSRELVSGLAQAFPNEEFLHCYRPKQFRRADASRFQNLRRRLLLPPLPTFRADLFHALNQRLEGRPAKKVISTFHDLFVITGEYSSPEFRRRFAEQARHAAQNSDLIITVSQFTANQVCEHLGFDRSRLRVIAHGVHAPETVPKRRREKMILFVGALQRRKNVIRLVEAFESLSGDWRLVLAGSPSGYQSREILERIERSCARDRVHVTGYLSPEELNGLYVRASIFAFPSLDEGFGMPVLEAMAHRVPVITSNRSALPEVAGEAAILINPENTEDLRAAFEQLIEDPDLRERLVRLGQARAALFNWDRAVHATHAVYQELLRL